MPLNGGDAAQFIARHERPKKRSWQDTQAIFKTWLGLEPENLYYYTDHDAIGEAYARLDIIRRTLFLKALMGPCSKAVGRALELAPLGPYQIGPQRSPFRAPKHGQLSATARGRILVEAAAIAQNFDVPPITLAELCPYIPYYGNVYSSSPERIFVGAIESGDDALFALLIRAVRGEHPVSTAHRSIIRALMGSSRPEGWMEVERLLLAAQREEGLRQTIFESADELHPEAFKRLIRLTLEHNLLRFTSVIRAFMVWFPGIMEEGNVSSAARVLGRLLDFLGHPDAECDRSDSTEAYLRLWADAYFDIDVAVARAKTFLESEVVSVRRATVRLVSLIRVSSSVPLLVGSLLDKDLTVASEAVDALRTLDDDHLVENKVGPVVWIIAERWPSEKRADIAARSAVWDLLLSATPPSELTALVEHIDEFSLNGRQGFASRINKILDVRVRRSAALKLFGDASESVRNSALESLADSPLSPWEATVIEDLLARKSSGLRKSALRLLQSQAHENLYDSGKRLLASKDANKRKAGIELLIERSQRHNDKVAGQVLSQYFQDSATQDEVRAFGDSVEIGPQANEASIESGFGFVEPSKLTYYGRPNAFRENLISDSAFQALESLHAFIHQHRDYEFTIEHTAGESYEVVAKHSYVLGDSSFSLRNPAPDLRYDQQRHHFPLAEMFEPWIKENSSLLSSHSGILLQLELAIHLWYGHLYPGWSSPGERQLANDLLKPKAHLLTYWNTIRCVLPWIRCHEPEPPMALIDLAHGLIWFYEENLAWAKKEADRMSWRTDATVRIAFKKIEDSLKRSPDLWSKDEVARAYALARYVDEPLGAKGRATVFSRQKQDFSKEGSVVVLWGGSRDEFLYDLERRLPCGLVLAGAALDAGVCAPDEFFDRLPFKSSWGNTVGIAHAASKRDHLTPAIREMVDQYLSRLVDIESRRGDLPTDASQLLGRLRSGLPEKDLLKLLAADYPLSSRPSGGIDSKPSVFLTCFLASQPAKETTPELTARALTDAQINPIRLVELAFISIEWAAAVELAIGWPGFEDAAWWFYAHTSRAMWTQSRERNVSREGKVSERTNLSQLQRSEGTVDAAWYRRVRSQFDKKQWAEITKVAKFASDGSGHSRARLFSAAMDGEVALADLMKKVRDKRNGDAVRALGLVPLDRNDPQMDIVARYKFLQEFLRGSRQFGSMRQVSEKTSVAIALDNLAHLAGYVDSLRLTWALEAAEAGDLKGEGLTVVVDGVSVRLHYDLLGEPQLQTAKNGAPLKEIPSAAKKSPEVKALVDRRSALKKQAQRMRLSLEEAMQRGDAFHPGELEKLMEHPGLAPMLRNLIFTDREGACGFLGEGGVLPGSHGELLLAHPYDLLTRGDWPDWQRKIFQEERIQPFKQAFRELYVLTAHERESLQSTRYGGHQLQPRQALAILSKRGWVFRPEEGVSKTLYEHALTARLQFDEMFYTPADIEGITLASLTFMHAGTYRTVPLADVPPRIFSEVMRDLDLVVSVASMVGIDPEASESTTAMRASVVREMAVLTKLGNISFSDHHVLVQGKLGEYSVHLGSGVVHQRARGQLVIVAVRQPQRGRLFLPFVDDDPRTAEIASKVLLLARDDEIKDPSILHQIISAPL